MELYVNDYIVFLINLYLILFLHTDNLIFYENAYFFVTHAVLDVPV